MEDLENKKCVPCEGGVKPLTGNKLRNYTEEVDNWEVINDHHIVKKFKFPDFKKALDFVNKIGELAEQENHHPDILLGWGKVEITLFTHAIDGLSENDFIVAKKIDLINNK